MRIKKFLSRLFSIISIGFIIYLAITLWPLLKTIKQEDIKSISLGFILSLLSYVAGISLLAYSWSKLLNQVLSGHAPTTEVMNAYFQSGIAKYVPGNFAQQVGRVILLKNSFSKTTLSLSVVLEFIAFSLSAGIIGLLNLNKIKLIPSLQEFSLLDATLLLFSAVLLLFISIACFHYLKKKYFANYKNPTSWRNHSWELCKYFLLVFVSFVFISLPSGIFGVCILPYSENKDVFSEFFLAFPLAWIAGFITPGSPAGIGPREFVFMLFLKNSFPVSSIALISVLMRLVNIAGDLSLFFFATTKAKIQGRRCTDRITPPPFKI